MTTLAPDIAAPRPERIVPAVVARLRSLATRALPPMFLPDDGLFAFRLRRIAGGSEVAGISLRYTAITLIGLVADDRADWRMLPPVREICGRLVRNLPRVDTVGDAALIAWAARATGCNGVDGAWRRLADLLQQTAAHPTVGVAWALAAASLDDGARPRHLRARLAAMLLNSWNPRSGLFPHAVGETGAGARGHVACFADQVYPIHALATYAATAGDAQALDAAACCARRIADLQGDAGQWWWHYDHRSGMVVEGYPVYAIHQDAMAPMALRALAQAGGGDFSASIARGLQWLETAPELNGASLIDENAGMVWRKVCRREPAKTTRYLQAAASRAFPRFRIPGTNALFPPRAVDYEDRPYHWGWFLYAWY